jgi:hypothetical protein
MAALLQSGLAPGAPLVRLLQYAKSKAGAHAGFQQHAQGDVHSVEPQSIERFIDQGGRFMVFARSHHGTIAAAAAAGACHRHFNPALQRFASVSGVGHRCCAGENLIRTITFVVLATSDRSTSSDVAPRGRPGYSTASGNPAPDTRALASPGRICPTTSNRRTIDVHAILVNRDRRRPLVARCSLTFCGGGLNRDEKHDVAHLRASPAVANLIAASDRCTTLCRCVAPTITARIVCFNITPLQSRERCCEDSAKVMQVFLQSRRQRKLAELDVQSSAFWCAAHWTNGILGRIRKGRQPEHRPVLFVDGILGAHDTVADGNADPEPVLIGRRRHYAPVGPPIGQDGAEHDLPVRKFSPHLNPRFFVEANHQSGLIVQILEVSMDPDLRGKVVVDLSREKVSVIVNETVACDAPEIGIVSSGHMQSVSNNARIRGRIGPNTASEAGPTCLGIFCSR